MYHKLFFIIFICLIILWDIGESSDMNTVSKYKSYYELNQHEREGIDYEIVNRRQNSTVAIIAPHGGGIEPGTTELAEAVAGQEYTFYSFVGLKLDDNWELHLSSINFDEPVGANLVQNSEVTIVLHGCSDEGKIVYLGGLDKTLQNKVRRSLKKSGFRVGTHPYLLGEHSQNICNQNLNGMGLQIEISEELRRSMFEQFNREGRKKPTPLFYQFVSAIRKVLVNIK